ncbi:DUF6455 family protein [Oricola sp.]|uniref:DUF6455 family protein n=1 Tax=Oricola sp. TaxID=1979950 RepID=UPI0025E4E90F|nr:DUF6455 family protein [Oricola sp.]MCI5075840.1 DUF6455 family protein [Oricola sp.]
MLSIRHFFATPRRGMLFHVMVEKLGLRQALDARPQVEAVVKRAQSRCAGCGREDSCQVWLSDNDSPAEAPYFCKNHDMLERLKHEVEAEAVLQPA